MRRREFFTLLGSAAATWPLAARAQQPVMPVIGFLHSAWPEPYAPMLAAFRQGLAEIGYIDGQNVAIEYRWAEGRLDRLPSMAAELVAKQVAALVTGGANAPVYAAKAATTTIPIVFTIGGDPVQYGLVGSIAHPLANVTGVTFFTITLGPKRLEILRELVPKASVIAVLVSSDASEGDANEVQEAARAIGQAIHIVHAGSEQDIDAAFRQLVEEHAEALLIVSSPLFTGRREQIVTLANYHRIPTIYSLREYVASGGLVSYGASIKNAYRQSGVYAGRILKGAQPADLPIQQPTKFELVINLKTAKALGLTVPDKLLALADEVIE